MSELKNKFAAYKDSAGGCWIDIRYGACPWCILVEPHRHRLGIIVERLQGQWEKAGGKP